MEGNGGLLRYRGEGFDLRLDPRDPAGTANGNSDGPVDLAPLKIMELIRAAATAPGAVNFVSSMIAGNVTQTDQPARP